MNINLKLSKIDELKLREVMKKDRRPFIQGEVKRWFLDKLNNSYLLK